MQEWECRHEDCPQQGIGTNDCAVFTLLVARALAVGVPLGDIVNAFTQKDVTVFWRVIVTLEC